MNSIVGAEALYALPRFVGIVLHVVFVGYGAFRARERLQRKNAGSTFQNPNNYLALCPADRANGIAQHFQVQLA